MEREDKEPKRVGTSRGVSSKFEASGVEELEKSGGEGGGDSGSTSVVVVGSWSCDSAKGCDGVL